jgi:GTP diphosphokinase / guanosine-3',5'-bis(diphosphate) 3'-diphosphatase
MSAYKIARKCLKIRLPDYKERKFLVSLGKVIHPFQRVNCLYLILSKAMTDTSLILKALEFAAGRHRSQYRKGLVRIPYINHPIQVANLLVNYAGETNPVLLSAAILHDVVEDTVNSVEERDELIGTITEMFGEEILSLTLEVTDDKTLEKKERKRLQVENALYKSDNAKKLKIADKIMNLQDIADNPPADWPLQRISDYFDWAENVVAGLRGVNNKLEVLFDECIVKGRIKYGLEAVRKINI